MLFAGVPAGGTVLDDVLDEDAGQGRVVGHLHLAAHDGDAEGLGRLPPYLNLTLRTPALAHCTPGPLNLRNNLR